MMGKLLLALVAVLSLGAVLALDLPQRGELVLTDGSGAVVGMGTVRGGVLGLSLLAGFEGTAWLTVTDAWGRSQTLEVRLGGGVVTLLLPEGTKDLGDIATEQGVRRVALSVSEVLPQGEHRRPIETLPEPAQVGMARAAENRENAPGRPDDAGRPEHAGRPDHVDPPEGAGKPDDAGPPDHAGRPEGVPGPNENANDNAHEGPGNAGQGRDNASENAPETPPGHAGGHPGRGRP